MDSTLPFQQTRGMKPQTARKSQQTARKSQQNSSKKNRNDEDLCEIIGSNPSSNSSTSSSANDVPDFSSSSFKPAAKPRAFGKQRNRIGGQAEDDAIDLCHSDDDGGGDDKGMSMNSELKNLPFVSVENLVFNFPHVKQCELDFDRLLATSMRHDPVEIEMNIVEGGDGVKRYYYIAFSKSNPEKVYKMKQTNRYHYSVLQKGLLTQGTAGCDFIYKCQKDGKQALTWWLMCEHGDAGFWLTQCFPEDQWEVLSGDTLDAKFLMAGGTTSNPFCTLMRYNRRVFCRSDAQQNYINKGVPEPDTFQLLSYDPYTFSETLKMSGSPKDSDWKPTAERTKRKRSPVPFSNAGCRCAGCQRTEDCGECDICTQKVAADASSKCFARRCTGEPEPNNNNKRQKATEQKKAPKKKSKHYTDDDVSWPKVGGRVYALWKGDKKGMWYWGEVTAVDTEKELFDVRFDDGDFQPGLCFDEVVTESLMNNDAADAQRRRAEQKKKREQKARKEEEKRRAAEEELRKKAEEQKEREEAERRKAEEPKELDVVETGDACYARYKDGKWYRGTITSIFGDGPTMKCSVNFDDGDIRNNCGRKTDVKTVEEYLRSGLLSPNFSDLQKRRCKNCSLCAKPDCGTCKSCVNNKISTTITNECCMHKICLQFDPEYHAQNIPRFPKGWVYASGWGSWPSNKKAPECRELESFRFLNQNTEPRTIYYRLEGAGNAAGVDDEDVLLASREIFCERLGLKVRKTEDHFLVNKGFCQVWQTRTGAFNVLYGHVQKCELEYGVLIFTINYNETSLNDLVGPEVPSVVEINNEAEVWGGCVLYELKTNVMEGPVQKMIIDKVISVQHWYSADQCRYALLDPEDVHGPRRPKKIMNFRGWKLEFEARTSLIPNAGLGVFMKATPTRPVTPTEKFRLEEGELLDIGIYGPLTKQDTKTNTLNLFKDFIHSGKCESWSFEPPDHHKTDFTFDITDNDTGDLHEVAQRNVPSFVNETDGRLEVPTISAGHDPQNAVHYLLGHKDEKQGAFVLPRDTWLELKIDYGPDYERVRVKKGYSRLDEEGRIKMENDIKNDVSEKLRDILFWSVNDCEECLKFVEDSKEPSCPPQKKEEKVLIAMLCFYSRCTMVKREFNNVEPGNLPPDACDCGFSTMGEKKLLFRMGKLIKKFLDLWENDEQLKGVILREEAAVFFLSKLLHKEASYLKGLNAATLRVEISFKIGCHTGHARFID